MDHISTSTIVVIVSAAVVVLAGGTSWIPKISDYQTHPCKRDCLRTKPRVCEYNFTIEHYQTLSRACYNCPFNATDCGRPHCVPADGFMRAIKVVNRMMPGPALHVCQDDTIVVNVYNQLGDFEGTSIHWHGILQEGTPHMDGVAMITQCPISVHSVFQYKFQAKNTGTHYWHAHAGLQRGDGIFGALVVRDTSVKSVMAQYDHDLPEHTIIIQDWLDEYASSKFSLHHHSMQDNQPTSILINGMGTKFGHTPTEQKTHDEHEMSDMNDAMDSTSATTTSPNPHAGHMKRAAEPITTMDPHMGHNMNSSSTMGPMMTNESMSNMTNQLSFVPHSVFRVVPGKSYRFRLISNGILNCPLKVSVEKHKLIIIATDGYDLEPVQADSVTLFAGERYDVVIKANQPVGNYWIHVIGLADCHMKNTSQTAILRYEGALEEQPKSGQEYADGDRSGTGANPLIFTPDDITVGNMTSSHYPDDIYTAHDVRRFYMNLGYNKVENYHFLDPQYYPLSAMYEIYTGSHGSHMLALQMNNITFKPPMSPVLSQFEDLAEDMFCNETAPSAECGSELCECVHRIKVDLNEVVELVLVSDGIYGPGNHPMHMHGHNFFVLGMAKLRNSVTRADVVKLDAQGKLQRNLRNPIKKDTILVPDGGYTIVRFRASNPGFWMFHCHVDFHFALGMSVVFQVGELHEMTATPRNFPRCGSWYFTEEGNSRNSNMCNRVSNGANERYVSLLCLLGTFILFKQTRKL